MKRYLSSFFVFVFLIAGLSYFAIIDLGVAEKQLTWMIYFYFCLLTLLMHLGVVRTTKERPQVFIRFFMGATTIKLLLHLGVIVIYSLFHREQAVRFIFTFLIFYILFTVFEVMMIWKRK